MPLAITRVCRSSPPMPLPYQSRSAVVHVPILLCALVGAGMGLPGEGQGARQLCC